MLTYRLEFSSEPQIVSRRLEKAAQSGARGVIVTDSAGRLLKRDNPQFQWVLETQWQEADLERDSWADEIHLIVSRPAIPKTDHSDLRNDPRVRWVIQPESLKSLKAWIQWIQWHRVEFPDAELFFDFSPWEPSRPQRPTVHEIVRLMHLMKYHFPNLSICRRPGVEMKDDRIPGDFELEAGQWREDNFNFNHQEPPTVSIVIPTYNSKFFLFKVLEHLGSQTVESSRYEVVVVDDGGSDETLKFIKTFGIPKGIQLKYVYWPRPRLRQRGDHFFRAGLARNLGVRLSRGQQLIFLDSDILVPSDFIETVIREFEFADVLQFPRLHIQQSQSNLKVQYDKVSEHQTYIEEENYWRPFFESSDWMKMEKFWKYTCTYALAVRKSDFLSAGRFKRFYVSYGFEDTELGYSLSKLNKRFKLVPQKVLHLTSYSQSEYQMSQVKRKKLLRRTAKLFFLSSLDIDNYYHFYGFMAGENPLWPRLKTSFGSKYRSTDDNATSSSRR